MGDVERLEDDCDLNLRSGLIGDGYIQGDASPYFLEGRGVCELEGLDGFSLFSESVAPVVFMYVVIVETASLRMTYGLSYR